jgi:DNA-binding NtrC family response regulator
MTQLAANTRSQRVLVIEDDAELRSLLRFALERDGHEVQELPAANELMSSLNDGQIEGVDVIVTDIRMPGVSGLDLLASLRAVGSRTPVVVMTAFGDAAERSRALRLGAFAFLDKPFEVDLLRELIRAAGEWIAR